MSTSKRCLNALLATVLIGTGLLAGCTTVDPYTGEERISKAAVGATVAAVGGAIIGSAVGKSQGAVIGAGIGAIAGGAIGHDMDHQEAMLRRRLRDTGVRVVRVGDDIRLVMPSDITFAKSSADINAHFYHTLNNVSGVLRHHPYTTIKVAGFTSNTGRATFNQILSEHRADNVADYLAAQHINPNRIMAIGYGKRYPIADNHTTHGRAQNRRVEITLHAIG